MQGWFCGAAAEPPLHDTHNDLTCCHSERNAMK